MCRELMSTPESFGDEFTIQLQSKLQFRILKSKQLRALSNTGLLTGVGVQYSVHSERFNIFNNSACTLRP